MVQGRRKTASSLTYEYNLQLRYRVPFHTDLAKATFLTLAPFLPFYRPKGTAPRHVIGRHARITARTLHVSLPVRTAPRARLTRGMVDLVDRLAAVPPALLLLSQHHPAIRLHIHPPALACLPPQPPLLSLPQTPHLCH